ncbi:hypothetical protein AMECASPLE_033013 [Ameca splendens]|uniref:Uncharacterized protein n=1 Tax=Ameca splendens TaxID=208324 RepID=A0ABV0ZTS7_9TELE
MEKKNIFDGLSAVFQKMPSQSPEQFMPLSGSAILAFLLVYYFLDSCVHVLVYFPFRSEFPQVLFCLVSLLLSSSCNLVSIRYIPPQFPAACPHTYSLFF